LAKLIYPIKGVNFVVRKLAGTMKPTMVLNDNGDGSWTLMRKGGPKEVRRAFLMNDFSPLQNLVKT
jgi:hypothetical protein